jgi:hypothetical protein
MAVFPSLTSDNIARTQPPGDLLESVADTEDRDTELEESGISVLAR